MAESNDKVPVVDILGLRRDIYQLLVLLLADDKVVEVDAFSDLADDYHEGEVNRLLIWVSIASRQLLDIDSRIENKTCGRFCNQYPGGPWSALSFRRACSTVIHAVEIVPYEVTEDEEEQQRRERYSGTVTVRGKKSRSSKYNTRAEVDFQLFAECCILLTDSFLED